ncbi:MAG: helix-turn-helix domain-containing protein [Gammaproteobacteria bacterium]|nr:helix-turn-helix domain-containing protein [Gammaproteobacteria bacterium]
MKSQRNNYHHKHGTMRVNTTSTRNVASLSAQQVKLFAIAVKMKKTGLADVFIVNAVRTALEFEGVADLMNLWMGEVDKKMRDEIVADIQEMIDECAPKEKVEEIYVKFNDLDAIAKNIRAFKDSLLQMVVERGGISKLSELTGIPQPSLSRFFNSNAMPQRSTVLKIAKALELGEIKMDILWSK